MSQTTHADARAVVSAYFEALDRGDLDALRASFAPSATWAVPGTLPVSGTYTGAAAIIDDFLAQMLARLDLDAPVSREVRTLAGQRDVAFAEWTAHATARTGEPYENDYCAVFETTDGLITAVREYFDTNRMGTALFGRS